MEKRLSILRHGEALGRGSGLDHDRKLSSQGKEQITQLGKKLERNNFSPDLILCSSAERTKQTLKYLIPDRKEKQLVRFEEVIYEATLDDLMELLLEVDSKVHHVLLVGHNPSLSQLAAYLVHENFIGMSPGQLIQLDLTVDDWKWISKGTGILNHA